MTRILSIAALAMLAAAPASAGDFTWSGTGPNGGTWQGAGTCARGEGSASCSSAGTYTSPAGRTFTSRTEATRSRSGGTRTTERTGPRGRTSTVTVTRSR